MRRIGEYVLVGTDVESVESPDLVILDTNVAIDIERFYFRGRSAAPTSLQPLLLEFPFRKLRSHCVDINYGWAASESCWKRGQGHDDLRRRRLTHSVGTVLQWPPERVRSEFARRRPPVDRDHAWPRQVPVRVAGDEHPDPRLFLIVAYGSLLFLLSAYQDRRSGKQAPLRVLERYRTWTSDVLGVRTSYAMVAAVDLVAGSLARRQAVCTMLKLGGAESSNQLAQKAWNAAWDMTFVSLTEGFSFGLGPFDDKQQSAVLVTRNHDPEYLRLASQLKMVIKERSGSMPFHQNQYELADGVDADQIVRLFSANPLEDLQRYRRDPESMADQAARAVHALESELGIFPPTSHDGWRLG